MLPRMVRAFLAVSTLLLVQHALRVKGWEVGHATFYGGSDGQGTDGGACGYQNVFDLGYGAMTTAISPQLYNDGLTCGACFEVRCTGDSACYGNSILVTATNLGPQWSTEYPGPHFDLAQPAFSQIANLIAGHVPIEYQRASCEKQGGVKFLVSGHTYYMQVLVYNVGGAGDVTTLSVKGQNSGWIYLTRIWGQNWETAAILDGQALSFSITLSDGRTLVSNDVADSSWTYGQTFQGGRF